MSGVLCFRPNICLLQLQPARGHGVWKGPHTLYHHLLHLIQYWSHPQHHLPLQAATGEDHPQKQEQDDPPSYTSLHCGSYGEHSQNYVLIASI